MTDLATAAAAYRAAQQALEDAKALVDIRRTQFREARGDLSAAVVEAGRAGARVRDLVAETKLSREWIRQLLRAAGVDPQ